MPNLDRSSSGVAADMSVGRVECSNVTGAIEKGTVQLHNCCTTFMSDLGGCVVGVRSNFVFAISIGARSTPAIPAAPTAAKRLASGEGEERMSRPPVTVCTGEGESPGSGRTSKAQTKERIKEVLVVTRTVYMNVLFVPL